MGKASSAKKVARAARTGGGRTRRGSSSWGYPALMAIVVILGSAGIVYSREQRQPDNTRPVAAGPGKAGDHWHAALGFYVCDKFLANVPQTGADPLGIHTHGDGIVHIHPFSAQSSGKRATLRVFFDTEKVEVSADQFKLPNDEATHKNGQKCGDATAEVQTKVWDTRAPSDPGHIVTGNPSDIRPKDMSLITIALVPRGADIPKPPSEPQLDKLGDVGPQPTEVPPDSSTTSTTPGDPATSTSLAPTSVPPAPTSSTSRP